MLFRSTNATCNQFLFLVASRLRIPQPPIQISITTDGNPQYLTALLKQFPASCIDYGRRVKHHAKNRLAAVIREKVLGDPEITSISTSVVEGYNNKIRQRISRFVRKTASFSKTIGGHIRAMDIFQFASNFIEPKNGMTPAMREGITDRIWTWKELLTYHFSYNLEHYQEPFVRSLYRPRNRYNLIPYLLVQACQSVFACSPSRSFSMIQRLFLHAILSLAD